MGVTNYLRYLGWSSKHGRLVVAFVWGMGEESENFMGPYKARILGWWVYPLLYGNNGSLDPGTYGCWTKNRFFSPKMDGENNGNTLLKWMIWGYHGVPLFLETPISWLEVFLGWNWVVKCRANHIFPNHWKLGQNTNVQKAKTLKVSCSENDTGCFRHFRLSCYKNGSYFFKF